MANGPPGLISSRRAGPPTSPGKTIDQISRELDIARGRKEFFSDRPDVSDDRALRRIKQADELQRFKTPVLDSSGNVVKGLTQARTPGGKTLAQKEQELAFKYGPTFREIASDIGYGLGSIAKGVAEKGVGVTAIVRAVGDYFSNKASEAYNNLNDVQKEIADNENKYTFASQLEKVKQLKNFRDLSSESQKDLNSFVNDASGILGVDRNRLDGFVNEPVGTFGEGLTKLPAPEISVEGVGDDYVESGQFKEDLQKSGIITVDDPATQEPLADSTKIPGTNTTLGDLKEELKKQNYNDFQITGIINEMTQRIISGEDVNAPIENIGEPEKSDDQVSFTPYNNPFNLEFKGQEGAEPGYGGETGQRFASFDTLDRGLKTGINRVAEIVGDGRTTEEFLDIYAPREDNPKSFDNYLASLEKKVGPTIEPNEIKDLTKGVIRFENTRDIADQYLDYLQRENDRIYGGIIS
tara:strand:- start:47 stop:1447 length:1401 start_codon:yes stop_codon:yes gene_type:complete